MSQPPKIKKILVLVALSLPMLALLAMVWLVHQNSGQFNNSFNGAMQAYKVLDLLEQTQQSIADAEGSERGYLLTKRTEFLEPYQRAMLAVRTDLAELKKLTAGQATQAGTLAALEKVVNEELVLSPNQSSADADTLAVLESGKLRIGKIRMVLARLHEELQQTLGRRQQEAEAEVAASRFTSKVLMTAVVMALILVVAVLIRLEKLQKFVTVCAWTGQVKFQGNWVRLEDYLQQQFGLSVSHALSQEATEKMTKELEAMNRKHPPAGG